MKIRTITPLILLLALLFSGCNPLSSLQVETIIPAEIEFPGDFSKVVFVNLATDINHDNEIDTILYEIISEEMSYGFMDAIQFSEGVDSTNFLFVSGFPEKEELYPSDTISWEYLKKISSNSNADIFIVLDSLNMSMESELFTETYYVPTEYYKYRELALDIYWSVYDLIEKKRLDKFRYNDTLYWDERAYSKVELEKKMPSLERSIREACYFAASDYADRVFPGWQSETRYYFHSGNKDFKLAAEYIKEYKWSEAIRIWEKYSNNIDKEISSRACFNLAFASEMTGNLDLAIAWAEKSKEIKNKSRTRYYISMLKTRKKNLEKLQKQIY